METETQKFTARESTVEGRRVCSGCRLVPCFGGSLFELYGASALVAAARGSFSSSSRPRRVPSPLNPLLCVFVCLFCVCPLSPSLPPLSFSFSLSFFVSHSLTLFAFLSLSSLSLPSSGKKCVCVCAALLRVGTTKNKVGSAGLWGLWCGGCGCGDVVFS